MKVCSNCMRVNSDDSETCIQCGGEDFVELEFPFYDDIIPYLEKECTEHIAQ